MEWEDFVLPAIFGLITAGLLYLEYIILMGLLSATALGMVIGLAMLFIVLLTPILFVMALLGAAILANL